MILRNKKQIKSSLSNPQKKELTDRSSSGVLVDSALGETVDGCASSEEAVKSELYSELAMSEILSVGIFSSRAARRWL